MVPRDTHTAGVQGQACSTGWPHLKVAVGQRLRKGKQVGAAGRTRVGGGQEEDGGQQEDSGREEDGRWRKLL